MSVKTTHVRMVESAPIPMEVIAALVLLVLMERTAKTV